MWLSYVCCSLLKSINSVRSIRDRNRVSAVGVNKHISLLFRYKVSSVPFNLLKSMCTAIRISNILVPTVSFNL